MDINTTTQAELAALVKETLERRLALHEEQEKRLRSHPKSVVFKHMMFCHPADNSMLLTFTGGEDGKAFHALWRLAVSPDAGWGIHIGPEQLKTVQDALICGPLLGDSRSVGKTLEVYVSFVQAAWENISFQHEVLLSANSINVGRVSKLHAYLNNGRECFTGAHAIVMRRIIDNRLRDMLTVNGYSIHAKIVNVELNIVRLIAVSKMGDATHELVMLDLWRGYAHEIGVKDGVFVDDLFVVTKMLKHRMGLILKQDLEQDEAAA